MKCSEYVWNASLNPKYRLFIISKLGFTVFVSFKFLHPNVKMFIESKSPTQIIQSYKVWDPSIGNSKSFYCFSIAQDKSTQEPVSIKIRSSS